jgi:hypothetical protein
LIESLEQIWQFIERMERADNELAVQKLLLDIRLALDS